jgi:siroheme synthase
MVPQGRQTGARLADAGRPRQTVVIYRGTETLSLIANQLIEHGLPASTPIRLI